MKKQTWISSLEKGFYSMGKARSLTLLSEATCLSAISAHSALMVFTTGKSYSVETLEEAGLTRGWEAGGGMLTESFVG